LTSPPARFRRGVGGLVLAACVAMPNMRRPLTPRVNDENLPPADAIVQKKSAPKPRRPLSARVKDSAPIPDRGNGKGPPLTVGRSRSVPNLDKAALDASAVSVQEESPPVIDVTAAVSAATARLAKGALEMQPVLDEILGDPEAVRPLLRAKLATTKFDYKNNAAKLTEHVKSLRSAIGKQMLQRKALAEAVAAIQEATTTRFQAKDAELEAQRAAQQADAEQWARRLQQVEAECRTKVSMAAEIQQEVCAAAEKREAQLMAALEAREQDIVQANATLDALRQEFAATREELSAARASLEAKAENVELLTQEKKVLEVEFHSYKEHHGTSNQQQMQAIAELKIMVGNLSEQVESTKMEVAVKETSVVQHQSDILSLKRQLMDEERKRRELHNAMQELKGNIRVFCRSRPAPRDAEVAVQSLGSGSHLSLNYNGEAYEFEFDKVFGCNSSQEQVFEEVSGLVQSALDGYKVCIFAYGQTGSGKTFTMQGTKETHGWGLIPRSLSQILETANAMRSKGWAWSLQASFIEVYNESLRDLLQAGADGPELSHTIVHDEAWGSVVTNMTTVEVTSMDQVRALMTQAAKHRAVGVTDMNATSSRSHAMFALYLRGTNDELNSELNGALHLVDLAGSERLDKSFATGSRLKETQNINRSLSSLADVFLAKGEEGRAHVPFRNSKLTHLLEPCLSGQGKTLMMVNVGPEQHHAHESLCSLRFASQVSQCNTGGKAKRSAKTLGPSGKTLGPAVTQKPSAPLRPQTPTCRSRPATPTPGFTRPATPPGGYGRATAPFG